MEKSLSSLSISQSGEVDVEPAVPMERSLTHLVKGGRRHSPWSKIAEHVFSLLEPGNLGEKYEDMHYSVDPASVNIFSFCKACGGGGGQL